MHYKITSDRSHFTYYIFTAFPNKLLSETTMENELFLNTINEFVNSIDLQFGIYLDACAGFREIREQTIRHQKQSIERMKTELPEKANMDYMDSVSHFYGVGDPNSKDNVVWHKTTQKEFKARRNFSNHTNPESAFPRTAWERERARLKAHLHTILSGIHSTSPHASSICHRSYATCNSVCNCCQRNCAALMAALSC